MLSKKGVTGKKKKEGKELTIKRSAARTTPFICRKKRPLAKKNKK